VEAQKQENTIYGPYTSSTDLKFERAHRGRLRFAVTFDVFNLFDQRNVQTVRGDLGFNQWTGEPFRYGDIQKPQNNLYDYYTMLSLRDPRVFSTGERPSSGSELISNSDHSREKDSMRVLRRTLAVACTLTLVAGAVAHAQFIDAKLDYRVTTVGKVRQVITNMGTFRQGRTRFPG